MSDLADRAAFERVCRMTCDGGSECGLCPCARPTDCELQDHPLFGTYRALAIARMGRAFDVPASLLNMYRDRP